MMIKYRIDENKIVKVEEGNEMLIDPNYLKGSFYNGDIVVKENHIRNGKIYFEHEIKSCKNIIIKSTSITSLEGLPETVYQNVIVNFNKNLKSLKGFPTWVERSIDVSYNNLTSLEYLPKKVGENFSCSHNKLVSLKGSPSFVKLGYYCDNNDLTSLKGCPKNIRHTFNCSDNQLTSLEYCPEKVGDGFYCSDNRKKFTREEVIAVCDVKGFIVV